MKQKNKLVGLLLAIIVLIGSIPTVNVHAVTQMNNNTGNNVEVTFINVAKGADTRIQGQPNPRDSKDYAGPGKGDATLVKFDKEYYLIDCGYDYAYSTLKQGLDNAGVTKLTGVIISHNHDDHYGGLKKLLNSNIKVEKIYYSISFGRDNVENIITGKKSSKNTNVTTQIVKKNQVVNALTGKVRTSNTTESVGLFVYGPAVPEDSDKISEARNGNVRTQNNLSMIVQVKGKNMSGLLLGDLFYVGLKQAKSIYNTNFALFPKNYEYDFSTYGHHGIRSTSFSDELIKKELEFYKDNIVAKNYILTSSAKSILCKFEDNDAANPKKPLHLKHYRKIVNTLRGLSLKKGGPRVMRGEITIKYANNALSVDGTGCVIYEKSDCYKRYLKSGKSE